MASLKSLLLVASLAVLATLAAARNVPRNVQNFLKELQTTKDCEIAAGKNFSTRKHGSGLITYCADHIHDYKILYLRGPGKQLVSMNVDYGYLQNEDDSRDDRDERSLPIQDRTTAFAHIFQTYGTRLQDLNVYRHPYVVFGNRGEKNPFNARKSGIQPLSVMAVVCNNKLVYGVWGDIDNDDTAKPIVGSASVALATACFGDKVTAMSGHDEDDVLYIAFPGKRAVPGPYGAKWDALNYTDFEASIAPLGNMLIEGIGKKVSS